MEVEQTRTLISFNLCLPPKKRLYSINNVGYWLENYKQRELKCVVILREDKDEEKKDANVERREEEENRRELEKERGEEKGRVEREVSEGGEKWKG